MTLRRTTLLLPCHSLDDFPTYLTGEEATSLLAAWTVLWHPDLILATGGLPSWRRADDPPDPAELAGELFVVPPIAEQALPVGWLQQLEETMPANPRPLTNCMSRADMVARLSEEGLIGQTSFPADVVADFFALGFAQLHVELLTRAMHYCEITDLKELVNAALDAAQAAACGEEATVRDCFRRAFDLLAQARQHFYPVDFFVLDMTLFSENTAGPPLREQLVEGRITNLLAAPDQIVLLAQKQPPTLTALRDACRGATACVVGGMPTDFESALAPPELIWQELRRSQDLYRQHVGHELQVFGQFSSDLSPLLPQMLTRLGFVGGLLTSFDGWSSGTADQAKSVWAGPDGETMDVCAIAPLDTGQDEMFLRFAETVSNSMQHDHVATVLLAGWAGHRSPFYEDLFRTSRYGAVLGQWVTLSDYFAESATAHAGAPCTLRASAGSRLSRDVRAGIADPISARAERAQNYVLEVHDRILHELADIVDDRGVVGTASPVSDLQRIQQAVLHKQEECESAGAAWGVNAWSFSRHMSLTVDSSAAMSSAFESVPGFGYVVSYPQATPSPVPLAEERTLRNEFFEAVISKSSGGIESLKNYGDRRNRLSQRLVRYGAAAATGERTYRTSSAQVESRVIADSVEVTHADDVSGQITSCGRLVDGDGATLAGFQQRFAVLRGSPRLLVEVSFDQLQPPQGDPWRSYFGSRLLWNGAGMTVRQGTNWIAQPATDRYLYAPLWIQISDPEGIGRSITYCPSGLPFHQRRGDQVLDTLLVVEGEGRRRFQFAISLDAPYATQSCLQQLTPTDHCVTKAIPSCPATTGWMFHISSRNVVVTHLARLADGKNGVQMRILETEGRATACLVSAFRPFIAGSRTGLSEGEPASLAVDDGRLAIDVGPYQWVQIEGWWSETGAS